jgi:hypothetical protein
LATNPEANGLYKICHLIPCWKRVVKQFYDVILAELNELVKEEELAKMDYDDAKKELEECACKYHDTTMSCA